MIHKIVNIKKLILFVLVSFFNIHNPLKKAK